MIAPNVFTFSVLRISGAVFLLHLFYSFNALPMLSLCFHYTYAMLQVCITNLPYEICRRFP